ncbi:hypothetical protein K461DRAFT_265688 [Myriangium duriaei CBS 260.36]|uniref:Uncharacterized protein n=1 Tax=Myriangium duriaei CBS 260.36 TaxID=1168546 RepID=A0A9P4JAU8_9PEZI|nr:hypothetical protein K461DRAFT_265688 [Myriangium duriaei CBS 260.36]
MGKTCGFGHDGGARTAEPGYECRVDPSLGLWNFCPSTVVTATGCGMNGRCIDQSACSTGCGPFFDGSHYPFTATCTGSQYCSTAISDDGLGRSYLYIDCGEAEITETIFATIPKTVTATTTSSTSSNTTASSTPGPTASALPNDTTTSPGLLPASSTSLRSSTPTSSASLSSSTPIGPIVGGILGGLAIICLTIFVIFLVRRRQTLKSQFSPGIPPSYTDRSPGTDQHELINDPSDIRRKTIMCSLEQGEINKVPSEVSADREPSELPATIDERSEVDKGLDRKKSTV